MLKPRKLPRHLYVAAGPMGYALIFVPFFFIPPKAAFKILLPIDRLVALWHIRGRRDIHIVFAALKPERRAIIAIFYPAAAEQIKFMLQVHFR